MSNTKMISFLPSKAILIATILFLQTPPTSSSSPTLSSSNKLIDSISSLPFDSNGRLANHILVFPAGKCAALIEADPSVTDGMFGHQFVALLGDAFQDVFGDNASIPKDGDGKELTLDACMAACLEKGTAKEVVASPLPNRYWDNVREEFPRLIDFVMSDSCGKVEYGFVNYHDKPVNIYWISPEGNKVFNQELGVGERETSFITTFVGHTFEFRDSENDELLYELTVPNTGVVGIKNFKQTQIPKRSIEEEVKTTMDHEWERHARVTRTFSPLGFQKGRLPDDMFASLGAYYYNNRNPPHVVLEEWGWHKGIFVNYWETDVNFIQIPWVMKKRWQKRLKEMVEAWTGVEQEITDMYGMRRYEKGARLLTHVDRHETHAASMIINIHQENVTKPWTIEVYDHANRLHEVVMEPGDIVYYESAKSLHGRNTPLQSGSYVNLFTHYRPLNDPDWWQRDNPEGTPEPVMDVGNCVLVGRMDQYSQGAVKCDNDAIGPHLSPTMYQAKNGDDLFQWWKMVGPKEDDTETGSSSGGDEL